MDYAALKTRMAGIAGSDAEVAAAINAALVTVQGDISVAAALAWCAANGVLVPLKSLSENAGPLQNVALAAMLMFGSLDAAFQLTSPKIQGLIGALQQGGVLTAEQAADLMAQGQTQRPGWTPFGRELDWADIQRARAFDGS